MPGTGEIGPIKEKFYPPTILGAVAEPFHSSDRLVSSL